jgi:MSHA pilin protein MshD
VVTQRGITLIELLFFIVIVSIALVGVLSVLNITAAKSSDPIVRKQAIATAEAMLEEVLLKDFSNATCLPSCAANSQADRPNYTSVDNYNGWNQTGIVDILASPIPGLSAYTVRVTVASAALGGVASANSKSVTVTVTGDGQTVSLTGFRMNYAP